MGQGDYGGGDEGDVQGYCQVIGGVGNHERYQPHKLNIARERARLGGDWAIAGVILTAKMREIAR